MQEVQLKTECRRTSSNGLTIAHMSHRNVGVGNDLQLSDIHDTRWTDYFTLWISCIEIADNALMMKRRWMTHTTPVLSSRVRLNWIISLLSHIVQFNLLFVTESVKHSVKYISLVREYAAQFNAKKFHCRKPYEEESVRKISYKIYNTFSRCSSSFEIKPVWEFKNAIKNNLTCGMLYYTIYAEI